MARKPFIAGNWKMCKNVKEAVSLAKSLKNKLKDVKDKNILICPGFTALCCVYEEIKGSNIKLGAQDMHFEDEGAFTGEISASMLKDFCEYVILGHSERRQLFNETDEIVNKKIKKALEDGLRPILCIGETLEQRENNETFDVIKLQLKNSLKDINKKEIKNVIIAYEPIWAIGTGKTASPEQAEEAVRITREVGLQTLGYFMIGAPGESPETARQTIDFAKKLKLDFAQFGITIPFPGTKLYQSYLESRNNHTDIPWEYFEYEGLKRSMAPVFESNKLSRVDLLAWASKAYREFYLRPSYLWQRLKQLKTVGDFRIGLSGFLRLVRGITNKE